MIAWLPQTERSWFGTFVTRLPDEAVSGCAGIARNGVSARGTSEGAVEATGATLEHKKRRGP